MNPKVFIHHEPDPIGAYLGVPFPLRFHRFKAENGVGGLARERDGNRLEILAIHTEVEGQGYLRTGLLRVGSLNGTVNWRTGCAGIVLLHPPYPIAFTAQLPDSDFYFYLMSRIVE